MPKISDLTAVTSPSGSDVLPIVSGGATKKVTVSNLLAGGNAMGSGTTSLDFGAFPGKSDASVDVTGQTSIAAGAVISIWIHPATTADHSPDEHILETLSVFAGNIVAGTGFTIYGVNHSQLFEPVQQHTRDNSGGIGTRLYGVFKVAWLWRN